MKSEFKFKNIYNMTTEEVKDMPVNIKVDDELVLVGTLTCVVDDYVYGIFNHYGQDNIIVELNEGCSWSLEFNEEK